MTNFQVYRKTLSFSLVGFLADMLALAVVAGCCVAGFFIGNTATDMAILGLGIGFIVGLLLLIPINLLLTNRIKAAQIAMMTKGVTEDKLPDHAFKEGFNEIKGRFGSITLFFFITNTIKGIFRQIGRGVTRLGQAVGGNVGGSIGSAVDSAVQTLIGYLCDCCLGWIMFRKDENAAKAGCEGAVIFFKHGKTLIRNVGRIFGMGFLSLLLIGGAFFGLFYLIFAQFPAMFQTLAQEITEIFTRNGDVAPEWLSNTTIFIVVLAAILAVVIWGCLHSVLIRPFILVGVLRNYMEAGKADLPTEADFAELEGKFPKFAKLRQKS